MSKHTALVVDGDWHRDMVIVTMVIRPLGEATKLARSVVAYLVTCMRL